MKIYNSLSRQIEEFEPFEDKQVGMYTCGPTVYDYVTIGNWRTYTLGDVLLRTLKFLGYDTTYVMNITDVGHLTGDNEGDADTGEDRMEKAAKREGKNAWEIAEYYTQDFLEGFKQLNLVEPEQFTKATEHIEEQIELVEQIEAAGFAYTISDGMYFDTTAYEAAGHEYGKLSTLDQIKEGARVEANPEKKDARDFALWKFSPEGEQRQMEWDSPWGKGFPGWHIECSAMSMQYLGEQFDVHVGGEDLRSTHHPNEIAQSEAATGKEPFVKYWVHGAFLQVDGGRMGKSLGNAYTLHDIAKRGFDPLALRYFCLTGHYRKPLNFTFEALEDAANTLQRLRRRMEEFREERERTTLSQEKLEKVDGYRQQFGAALENDVNLPEALAVVWQVVKSNIPGPDKYELLLHFDEVLGLDLSRVSGASEASKEIQEMVEERNRLRGEGKFEEADKVREEIENQGYVLEDGAEGTRVRKK